MNSTEEALRKEQEYYWRYIKGIDPVGVERLFADIARHSSSGQDLPDDYVLSSYAYRDLYLDCRRDNINHAKVWETAQSFNFRRPVLQSPGDYFEIFARLFVVCDVMSDQISARQLESFIAKPKFIVTHDSCRAHALVNKQGDDAIVFSFSRFFLRMAKDIAYIFNIFLSSEYGDYSDVGIERRQEPDFTANRQKLDEPVADYLADLLTHIRTGERYKILRGYDPKRYFNDDVRAIGEIIVDMVVAHEACHALFDDWADDSTSPIDKSAFDELVQIMIEDDRIEQPAIELQELLDTKGSSFYAEFRCDLFAIDFVRRLHGPHVSKAIFEIGVAGYYCLLGMFEDLQYRVKSESLFKRRAWIDDIMYPKTHPHIITRQSYVLPNAPIWKDGGDFSSVAARLVELNNFLFGGIANALLNIEQVRTSSIYKIRVHTFPDPVVTINSERKPSAKQEVNVRRHFENSKKDKFFVFL